MYNSQSILKGSFVVPAQDEQAAKNLVEIVHALYTDMYARYMSEIEDAWQNDDPYALENIEDRYNPPVFIALVNELTGDAKPVWCNCRIEFKQGEREGALVVPETLGLNLQTAVEDGDLKMERFTLERVPAPRWVKFGCDEYPATPDDCEYMFAGEEYVTVRNGTLRYVHIDMAALQEIATRLYKTPDGRYLKIWRGNAETPSSIKFVSEGYINNKTK
jgi:hypothetical protein